ncbi:MAG: flavodoxin [Pseudoflavonifractor sp.]|nr:flavodoxin [Pseudoflavonifractor sp.]
MKKIGIFYGSSTGTTADVASRIAKSLGVADADVHDVAKSAPSDVAPYDVLLLGTSTWGAGELQDDWYDFIDGLAALDLKDKAVALFGCGDETMSDTFCGGVGELHKRLVGTGARFIAPFPADVYDFQESAACDGDTCVGLLLDEVNAPEKTDVRIREWTDIVKKEA